MSMLDILIYPDDKLRQSTIQVSELTDDIKKLINDLTDTMYAYNGAGIAAIQVGRPEKIFLIDGRVVDGKEMTPPLVCINPELRTSGDLILGEEGCLSFPNQILKIKRNKFSHLKAFDINFQPFELIAEDFFARAIQHEFDHLSGKLFIDFKKKKRFKFR